MIYYVCTSGNIFSVYAAALIKMEAPDSQMKNASEKRNASRVMGSKSPSLLQVWRVDYISNINTM